MFLNHSLKTKVWLYLIVFSVILLSFLWFFQVVFLDTYYEWYKKKDLNTTANKIVDNYQKNSFEELFDDISYDKGVCIEVVDYSGKQVYVSNSFNRGCMASNTHNPEFYYYQYQFINSGMDKKAYRITNPRFQNKTLVYGVKLDVNYFAFISASLEPLDATIGILTNQLIYVTILVFFLSFLIGYFISKKLSNPIEKISEAAKQMAKGDYDVVFNHHDIEEINELADTLNYARDELSKTDMLRKELLANVGHDLKTPLTMIKAYAEMVRDLSYKDDIKREEHLNVIIEETDRLNTLVNDILDLSSIQSGTTYLNKETFDLVSFIKTILKRYEILNLNEDYSFIFEEQKEKIVCADKKRLEQVIYNLINNAIHYTGNDKKVTIQIIEKESIYRVEIIDTGKGIDPKDLPYIWDKYYKVDKNHKRNIIGTGLGLSIVKHILEQHQFIYGVHSIKEKGTCFYFELPKEKQ